MGKQSRFAVLLTTSALVVSTIAGCKAKSADNSTAMIPPDTALAPAPAPAAVTYTDQNIVALLDEANKADSSAAAYALGKTSDADVRAFAKLMVGEHHALRVQGAKVAKALTLTPQTPSSDPVGALGTSEMIALQGAQKGAEFDRTYIDQEVAAHKAVLELLDQMQSTTQQPELKKLIDEAKPVIEKHRDRAEEIQKKLAKTTAT